MSSSAATRSGACPVYVRQFTTTLRVERFARAISTPSTADSAFSTERIHAAQCMSGTDSVDWRSPPPKSRLERARSAGAHWLPPFFSDSPMPEAQQVMASYRISL
jgi:hypothetical protein